MYNLERVEIWEPSARGYQFRHRGACAPSWVRYNVRFWDLVGVERIGVDDGEFSKPGEHGHKFWDWRRSVIVLTPW